MSAGNMGRLLNDVVDLVQLREGKLRIHKEEVRAAVRCVCTPLRLDGGGSGR